MLRSLSQLPKVHPIPHTVMSIVSSLFGNVFIEHLLCARQCPRPWDTAVNETEPLPSQSLGKRDAERW